MTEAGTPMRGDVIPRREATLTWLAISLQTFGALFVLPGMVALLALSLIYVSFGNSSVVAAVFAGLAPAVIATRWPW